MDRINVKLVFYYLLIQLLKSLVLFYGVVLVLDVVKEELLDRIYNFIWLVVF